MASILLPVEIIPRIKLIVAMTESESYVHPNHSHSHLVQAKIVWLQPGYSSPQKPGHYSHTSMELDGLDFLF